MPHVPRIPLSPTLLPQQRIHAVHDLPAWPDHARPFVGYSDTLEVEGLPKRKSRNAAYLCQLEWAWSPDHDRLDAYYLPAQGAIGCCGGAASRITTSRGAGAGAS